MIYDNSKLQTYKNCPEQYRLKYLRCLKKTEEGLESHDRNFGSAIHKGLEIWYKGGTPDDMAEGFKQACPIPGVESTELAKTQQNGLLLLGRYLDHYKEEDKKWRVLSVEVADTFRVSEGLEFQVKIDLVVEQQGCIYFVDHKTTGKNFDWNYWGQFEPNSQITGYTAYCQAKYGECSGGIINGIKLGYRQRAYKGEPAGFHCDFSRQLFNRNKQQVEDWKHQVYGWSTRVDADTEIFGSVAGWCKNEGACRFCSYKPICISVNDEQVIDSMYQVHDPNDYLKNEKEGV